MIRPRVLLCSFALLAPLAAPLIHSQASQAPARAARSAAAVDEAWQAARSKIEALNRDMESALRKGDLLAVARFYSDDAILLGPRGQRIEGRDAIDRYWTGLRGPKDWKLTIDKLGGDPQTVYQIGRSRLVTEDGGRETVSEVEFVVVWRRQESGDTYRIEVDSYH